MRKKKCPRFVYLVIYLLIYVIWQWLPFSNFATFYVAFTIIIQFHSVITSLSYSSSDKKVGYYIWRDRYGCKKSIKYMHVYQTFRNYPMRPEAIRILHNRSYAIFQISFHDDTTGNCTRFVVVLQILDISNRILFTYNIVVRDVTLIFKKNDLF